MLQVCERRNLLNSGLAESETLVILEFLVVKSKEKVKDDFVWIS